jgi:hypothetical protein
MTIVAIPNAERKASASDVRRAVGNAVTRSRDALATHFPLAMTAGSQYVQTRQVAMNVLAGCCEVDPRMTVGELYELLDREGGSR